MKNKNAVSSEVAGTAERRGDSTKLVSLLALAAGAAAMPQTASANVVVQTADQHIGFGAGDSSGPYFLNLPGTHFGFERFNGGSTTSSGIFLKQYRTVAAGWASGGTAGLQVNSNGMAAIRNKSEAWDQGLSLASYARIGSAVVHKFISSTTGSQQNPGPLNHKYLALAFKDNGQWLYGWVEIDLAYTYGLGPTLTIEDYAYDDSGAQLAMGVPEPAPLGILALGALAFGASGVRSWRRNRTAPQS